MRLKVQDIAVFSMFGALMFASKLLMEVLPNIHLLGMLIMAITLVYRQKALYPIYLYVFADGLYSGFNIWWIPYLYIWTLLWAVTMLLPRNMPKKIAPVVYMLVCGLHGLLFGVLYAPAQALLFGYDILTTLAWIAAGFPFDVIHGISNVCMGILILPITKAILAADRRMK